MLEQWLEEFIGFIGMKIMMGPYVAYCENEGNRGITGIAVIETSHIAMHVWDEPVPAMMQLDVYSCAEFDPYRIADKLKQDFDCGQDRLQVPEQGDRAQVRTSQEDPNLTRQKPNKYESS